VSACFTPEPTSCAGMIAQAVGAARSIIPVQAYYFTSTPILHALAQARRRGVDRAIILDRSQDRTNEPGNPVT
jgi:phosphatidylserine/phosphatidylglycerophosphate/cardiolipin synthase-like enzyme